MQLLARRADFGVLNSADHRLVGIVAPIDVVLDLVFGHVFRIH